MTNNKLYTTGMLHGIAWMCLVGCIISICQTNFFAALVYMLTSGTIFFLSTFVVEDNPYSGWTEDDAEGNE